MFGLLSFTFSFTGASAPSASSARGTGASGSTGPCTSAMPAGHSWTRGCVLSAFTTRCTSVAYVCPSFLGTVSVRVLQGLARRRGHVQHK